MLVSIAAILVSIAYPSQAQALEIERWTAQSNQDGGSDVFGGTETRLTFQGQTDEGESVVELLLEMPEGSKFPLESVKVKTLIGLDVVECESTVEGGGSNGVKIVFPQGTPEGTLIMVEVNGIKFPSGGGSYGLQGSYTTEDEVEKTLSANDVSPIVVVGLSPAESLSRWLASQSWVQSWNSVKFLHLFFDPTIIVVSVPSIFSGWIVALALVLIGFPLAIPLGLFWSFLRMSGNRILKGIGSLYVNVIRGTPLFLQIYIAFLGLPLLGLSLNEFPLGVLVMVMNSSAYLAEIFRAGIQSINKGQFEASRSLGMTGPQTMLNVIIPQTIRRVIPTMTSEFILLYKDTSLLAAIGLGEIMLFSKTLTAATGNVTPYIVAAGFYLIVTLPLTKLISILEAHMADRDAGVVKTNKKKNSRSGGDILVASHESGMAMSFPDGDASLNDKEALVLKNPHKTRKPMAPEEEARLD